MQNEPVNLLAVFPARETVIKAVDTLAAKNLMDINRAAVVARTTEGESVYIDDSISLNEAGRIGGTLGSTIGILGMLQIGSLMAFPGIGPFIALITGLLLGGFIGSHTGRLATTLVDYRYPRQELRILAEGLEHGQAALLIEIDTPETYARIEEVLQAFPVKVSTYQRGDQGQ